MNYRPIIGITLFLLSITSCAQPKYGIKKTEAFFQEHQPGNIRVDEQRKPLHGGPDTINTIYLETKDVFIKWTAAWKNGKSFSVITTAIVETPLQVGINKISNQNIILRPAPGNKLWLLQLEMNETLSKPPVKAKAGEIILRGKSGKKTFIHRITSQIELASIPSV